MFLFLFPNVLTRKSGFPKTEKEEERLIYLTICLYHCEEEVNKTKLNEYL